MIAAKSMMARALAGTNPAWILAAAVAAVVAMVVAMTFFRPSRGVETFTAAEAAAAEACKKKGGFSGRQSLGKNKDGKTVYECKKGLWDTGIDTGMFNNDWDGMQCTGDRACADAVHKFASSNSGRKKNVRNGVRGSQYDQLKKEMNAKPAPASKPASTPAASSSSGSDCKPSYTSGKYTVMDCKEVPANQRTVKDWDCFVENHKGRQYRKCVKKSAATKFADEGVSSRYPYWGKKGTKFEGLRCSKSDGVTGCTTKWEGGKLKDVGATATPGANGCKFAWQTKDAKGKCVGCPPDRPTWDNAKKTCVAKSASGQNCEWFQKLDAKGKCVGCPPNTTWDNAKKVCAAAPGAAPVSNLASIPATVPAKDWCQGSKHWVKDQAGVDQCLCKDATMSDPPGGDWTKWCTVKKADWCKKPKHWVGDNCLCEDQNMEDPPGGDWTKWCTVRKAAPAPPAPAEGSWDWRKNRCKQLGDTFYVCSERDIQYDLSSSTGNPNFRGVDLANQCCRDSDYSCGSKGFFDGLKNVFTDGIFRGSRARNKDNLKCVDVYTALEGKELGLNAGGGVFSLLAAVPPNPFSAMGATAAKAGSMVAGAAVQAGAKAGAKAAAKAAAAKAATKYASVTNPDGTIMVATKVDDAAAAAGKGAGKGAPAAATAGAKGTSLVELAVVPSLTPVAMGGATAAGLIDVYKPYNEIVDPNEGQWDYECKNCVNTDVETGECRRCGDNDW